MTGFFDRMLGRNKSSGSAQQAKQRLRFVLVHDRVNLSPETLQAMKEEILAVISKYVNVANEQVDIALQQRDRNNNLIVAEVPFSQRISENPLPTLEDDDDLDETLVGTTAYLDELDENSDLSDPDTPPDSRF